MQTRLILRFESCFPRATGFFSEKTCHVCNLQAFFFQEEVNETTAVSENSIRRLIHDFKTFQKG
jgi:hypothetical protein